MNLLCSDPLPSAGCAGSLEPLTGSELAPSEGTADDAPQIDDPGTGSATADQPAAPDATPKTRPTQRETERALRAIGFSRREAETMTRAGLAALESKQQGPRDQLDQLRELLKQSIATMKGSA